MLKKRRVDNMVQGIGFDYIEDSKGQGYIRFKLGQKPGNVFIKVEDGVPEQIRKDDEAKRDAAAEKAKKDAMEAEFNAELQKELKRKAAELEVIKNKALEAEVEKVSKGIRKKIFGGK